MLNNLPVFFVSLATGNMHWEYNFLKNYFPVIERNHNNNCILQFDAKQDNKPFELLLLILKSFKNSKCIIEHKGKVKVLNYIQDKYVELK
jgi:hypothetical protein